MVDFATDATVDRMLCDTLRCFQRPRHRTMRQFAEQEIIIPSGRFEGLRFRCDRQPFSSLWFEAVDSQQFVEHIITGPTQSGKTLIGWVVPVLYHLFELAETVIAAVPDMDMVRDKWEQDLEPVLKRTKYWGLMPRAGRGSKGGDVVSIQFENGAILRFMSAGGSDKSRAGFTSRVICMTETDGFDVRTTTSSEANKIEQIEGRVRAYPLLMRRIYKECTLTTEEGHTWVRYSEGTASAIKLECPLCREYVGLEREHFRGWDGAATDVEAVRNASFFCAKCGEQWTEEHRVAANRSAVLVHRGQTVESGGRVVGPMPETRVLGFRWSAVNNLLVPAADIALDEWRAARAVDEDDAQRKLCQFVWAVPYRNRDAELVELAPEAVQRRVTTSGRGQFPSNAKVTVGIDVNKRVLHWAALAWLPDGTGIVIDYGRQGVKADAMGFDTAFRLALPTLHDKLGDGWTEKRVDRVLVDCRWQTDEVCAAVKALKDPKWRPYMGLGQGHWRRQSYRQPTKLGREVIWLGTQCYDRFVANQRSVVTFGDANYWKTWLHSRLVLDLEHKDKDAAPIMLYGSSGDGEHAEYAKHLTAEREVVSFQKGKGETKTWEAIRSSNHWLDATYMACVAAHRLQVATHEAIRQKPRTQNHQPRAADPSYDAGSDAPTYANEGFSNDYYDR